MSIDVKDLMGAVVEAHRTEKAKISQADQVRMAIIASLEVLGGLTVTDDDILFDGDKIVLPGTYEGRVGDAIDYLERYEKSQTGHCTFQRKFNYRPWDGAHAFDAAMMKNFGTAGIGKAQVSFFGTNPPALITIETGPGQSVQVPWGDVEFPPLEATFTLGDSKDREYGMIFVLAVDAPKKYRKHIEAFFQLVEEELKHNSIYKGRAITGGTEPVFLDVNRVDPKTIIFSEEVQTQLDANLWSLLKHTQTMRDLKIPLKRAVLLEGPYGTGKTSAGILTAQHAQANGWTYILCRTGKDDLGEVLNTAKLYAPAVVWFEDIDLLANGGTADQISKLLDMLDGITSKGGEVVAGFTTNFVEKIQKAVLRPGRLDAVIHVAELDPSGFKRLVENLVPAKLLSDIDYERVGKAFIGFLPAFAVEAINRAMRYSISRSGGKPDMVTTDDLVDAALGLRPQLALMEEAAEGANVCTLDDLFRDIVGDVINHTAYAGYDAEGDAMLDYDEDREAQD